LNGSERRSSRAASVHFMLLVTLDDDHSTQKDRG
jgi:hypothetical protein